MVPPFGQDVASVAPFSGRLASPSLLPSCNNKQERREASFIEGRNPFRLWGKEQRLGYLQQRCTQWSLRAPRLANLRWGDGKVATFAWHLSVTRSFVSICMPQGRDGVQVVALSIGPLCRHDITRSDRQIGNVSVTYVTLVPWWRERRRYVPMPQSWTIAGCQGHVSWLLSVKPDQWMHLSPIYTRVHGEWLRYANSTSQYSLAFSLSQRWLGLPGKSPMSSRHNVSVPSIREQGLRT